MKKCSKCKAEDKPLIINSRNKFKSGEERLQYLCRDCTSKRHREYRKTERGAEVYANIRRRQYKKYPEKAKARSLTNQELKTGKITRPDCCSKCNEDKKLDAHHDDYSKPLEVRWMCRSCHLKWHRENI